MRYLAVSQRVYTEPAHRTRVDALDQRWWQFLRHCALAAVPVPNGVDVARLVTDLPIGGILLTGGNDLAGYGGDAPERDRTETALVAEALRRDLPLLGVCRGMQVVQQYFGVEFEPVEGHVLAHQEVVVGQEVRVVNSYHRWATTVSPPPLRTWARTGDGVVKAVRHESARVLGIMWHPERMSPFQEADRELLRQHFTAADARARHGRSPV